MTYEADTYPTLPIGGNVTEDQERQAARALAIAAGDDRAGLLTALQAVGLVAYEREVNQIRRGGHKAVPRFRPAEDDWLCERCGMSVSGPGPDAWHLGNGGLSPCRGERPKPILRRDLRAAP